MAHCSNCEMELSQWEQGQRKPEFCDTCWNASPQEQAQRRETILAQRNVNVLDTLPKTAERRLLLGLHAGKQLVVTSLLLFPERDVQQFLSLKAKAQEELAGFSTGIGFLGSPGWAIGGAAALGFVESLVSNSKAKKGLDILNDAVYKQAQLKTKGVFFNIHEISESWQPNPVTWRATQAPDVSSSNSVAFIHNGDEFIWGEVDDKPTAIRWASVESYQLA